MDSLQGGHTGRNCIYHRFCYSYAYSFDFWYEEVNYYFVIITRWSINNLPFIKYSRTVPLDFGKLLSFLILEKYEI